MIKINLLPVRAAKKKETFMNQIYVGILVLVLTFGVMGWRAFSQKAKIADTEKEITARKKELDDLKETVKKVQEFEAKKAVLQQKITTIETLEAGRDRFIQLIDQISQAIPGGAWVGSVTIRSTKGGAAAIALKGSAYEKDDVGIFISNLSARSQFIKDVQLGGLNQASAGSVVGLSLYNYDLTIVPQGEANPSGGGDKTKKKP
jgi:type IV pilus assembly protein PilN